MMKRFLPIPTLSVLALLLASPLGGHTAEPTTLDDHLDPLRPFLGTWRGEFKSSTPEKPVIDIARWERALNGQAIRVLHSVNDGLYAGESLIYWDKEKSQVRYFYLSTAGFRNEGTMTVTNQTLTGLEKVLGNPDGVTEVRTTYELRSDGTVLNRAEYMKDGHVSGTREVVYRKDDKAEVRFK